MRHYIIRSLLLMPVTLLGITFLVFCLTRLVPGGPVERLLQEQAIGALSGDKTAGTARISDNEVERLEDLYNLHEPMWKAYLQWLGVLRRKVEVSKAEFGDDGCAYVTLTSRDGRAHVLEVRRDGDAPVYLPEDWLTEERWRIALESPGQRSVRWAERQGVEDHDTILAHTQNTRWRAVAFRKSFSGILQGDLGLSYKYNEPVVRMMMDRLPVSLYFGILGAFISYVVSIPLGVYKALKHRSLFDGLSSIAIFIGYAVPGFALGAVLLVYFGARLEWFPLYGLTSPDFSDMGIGGKIKDLAMHTVLPLSCYVISTFAITTMMMKNSLMENLSADYIRTAVSKGVSFRKAVWHHAFRNSFIPIASTLGNIVCAIVGGSILIERVFDIQGFGMLSFQALMDKDYSLIMGTLLLSSILIIIGNLVSDILVACLDPRINFD